MARKKFQKPKVNIKNSFNIFLGYLMVNYLPGLIQNKFLASQKISAKALQYIMPAIGIGGSYALAGIMGKPLIFDAGLSIGSGKFILDMIPGLGMGNITVMPTSYIPSTSVSKNGVYSKVKSVSDFVRLQEYTNRPGLVPYSSYHAAGIYN
jgi:hypothetical protein